MSMLNTHPSTQDIAIAAFDFDHTLIDRDSLLPFLFYEKGKMKASLYLASLGHPFTQFLVGQLSRQGIKEKIMTRFFRGMDFAKLEKLGQCYAELKLDRYLKPEAYQRLRWHQLQGHRCILVSASFGFYLKPWAIRHGFETVLSSSLELTEEGVVTGRLAGLNCWGAEKKRRLIEYLGSQHGQIYAYGDSQGDQELLAMADFPFYRCYQ